MAVLILGFTLTGLLQVFIRCSTLAGIAQEKSCIMSILQSQMEDIHERDYADLVALYAATASGEPAETFPLAPLTGMGVVYITRFTAGDDDLLQIKIVGSWIGQEGRVFGEDINRDGIEDAGEDVDGDGDLSSIATVMSLIALRI